jgi:hypothetical protein
MPSASVYAYCHGCILIGNIELAAYVLSFLSCHRIVTTFLTDSVNRDRFAGHTPQISAWNHPVWNGFFAIIYGTRNYGGAWNEDVESGGGMTD